MLSILPDSNSSGIKPRPIHLDSPSRRRTLGVLVGFDGSDHAVRALVFAARTAQHKQSRLTVVTTYSDPIPFYVNYASLPAHKDHDARRQVAERTLDIARTHLADYSIAVDYRAEHGSCTATLTKLSGDAQITVVGSPSSGGLRGLIMRSVASTLPARAASAVIIVSADYNIAGPDDATTASHDDVERLGVSWV